MKFRKKPVTISAIQWTRHNTDAVLAFMSAKNMPHRGIGVQSDTPNDLDCLLIDTLEGVMTAQPYDWIIRGIRGEFYPCKPDIFEASYEPVLEEDGK